MELNITEFIKKETNLKDGNKLQEFTERELNILIYKALKEQLILSDVVKSFTAEQVLTVLNSSYELIDAKSFFEDYK
jgi:hypothetical protein